MLKKEKGKGPAATGALEGAICPAAGRARTEYFTLSPSPPCAKQDGWLRCRGCLTREKDLFLFLSYSIKSTPPLYTLGLALYPARDTLGHQLSYLQTIERAGKKLLTHLVLPLVAQMRDREAQRRRWICSRSCSELVVG